MWDTFVGLVRVAIIAAAHVSGGSLGTGIVAVSVLVRVALLPWTLRLARHACAQQAKVVALEPRIAALRKRYARDPLRLATETQAVYRAAGVRFMTPGTLLSFVVQAPLLGAVVAAVRRGLGAGARFLWVGDLARPDLALIGIASALSAAIAMTTPRVAGQPATPAFTWMISGALTLVFLWSASSALTLSVGAGSLVSLAQNWLVSRDRVRA
jgi:YidC/Oxa1 family membrane protein insertase